MSNINVNDIVRIGNGKVDYIVEEVYPGGVVKVRGGKNNRAQDVEASRLTVVHKEASSPKAEENVISLSTHNHMAPALPAEGIFLLIDAEEPVEYKSFDAAAFALSRNHTYYVATIVKDRGVTVQRKRVA